ncbi:MAG: hypothetical protein HFH15_06000 [Ruminococcus sp.]|nr:hypothetical protein [Ruminococcus sp.]
MDTLYWIGEYGKVFCGYMFLMFIWPSTVFSRYLRNKDKIFRFSFCISAQIVIINSIVLILGLLHVLNRWMVNIIFYGIFLVSIIYKIRSENYRRAASTVFHLITGTYGLKLFLYKGIRKIFQWIRKQISEGWNLIHDHFLEYMILLIVVLYGMIYFSYGVFQDYNYGFGDMYVHHQWIQGLVDGKIFYDGVYPEAMHCFIYCLHVLFGIRLYSCILFLAGIHVFVFLISIYALLKEVFQWKYTPLFVLIIFLTIDLMCINEVYSMSRLQWTIPQEFGLFIQFLCALYLIRYLKSSNTIIKKKFSGKYYWNEHLLLFMLLLSASISIHFYTTIMAFLLCFSFAVFFWKRVFKKERFIPLVLSVLCAVFISVMPMAAALMSGIPFQASIDWAVGVMHYDHSQDGEELIEEEEKKEEKDDVAKNTDNMTLAEKIKDKIWILYEGAYVELYREERAFWIIASTALASILWLIYRMNRIREKFFKKRLSEICFDGYLPIIIASILYMVVYASEGLGIPQLIAGSRLCSSKQVLILAVIAMPVDMIFSLLALFCRDYILQIGSIVAAAGIYCSAIISGNFHGYLYCEFSRYNAAVMVTNSIINNFPKNSYVIVSPTDEVYQIIQYGRHEELLTFFQKMEKGDYKLPTEYVFLYIEKKPIQYGQSHFFTGPGWLAEEKYAKFYSSEVSQCPEIYTSKISEREAFKNILLYERPFLTYRTLESRTILETKAYLWCQNFSKLYPFEVSTYYEDNDFVCYYFKQNPYALYDLAIEDWERTEGIEW